MRNVRVAISIAGSDSIGGAGIQADLKTFSAFGVYGTTAITAVTAQNTFGVSNSLVLPGKLVYDQIRAVAEDSGIDAGKTGMLGNVEVIQSVTGAVKEYGFPLVLDPVMIAKSGASLLEKGAIEALKRKLIPESMCVTPNLDEVRVLAEREVRNVEEMMDAAEFISGEFGCEAVLVKGGHLNSPVAKDVLYYRGKIYEFESQRVEGCYHGTGCSLSAGIAAGLALGLGLVKAVERAKEMLDFGIRYSAKAGRGCDSVNPVAIMERKSLAFEMLGEMRQAVERLSRIENATKIVPEVGMNIAYAMPFRYLKSVDDVLSLDGRIVRGKNRLAIPAGFEFGASRHLSRALIAYMQHFPEYRAVINVRYDERLMERLRNAGLKLASYDRRDEPEDVKRREGATIPWGIQTAIEKSGRRPDVIYHLGDFGKEPMILIFAKSPVELVEMLEAILEGY
ncbi:bifunctional hydroxymethylpyrimidine kinase/phosphomethylpyrimidine kinase [Geoglobus acetivorans]|uniref:Phosphomethylpyrimidine kinase n=1 Tax=Geoglobus acetivorans TaxID=565033 RepID=A0A0A7GHZ7_GEOAI|nr:Phosphomethylpyrimidine kinase [Geoglobus acetivorans]